VGEGLPAVVKDALSVAGKTFLVVSVVLFTLRVLDTGYIPGALPTELPSLGYRMWF